MEIFFNNQDIERAKILLETDALNTLISGVSEDYMRLGHLSFGGGLSRAMDITGSTFRINLESPILVDRCATASDWNAVGNDMKHAYYTFISEHPEVEKLMLSSHEQEKKKGTTPSPSWAI